MLDGLGIAIIVPLFVWLGFRGAGVIDEVIERVQAVERGLLWTLVSAGTLGVVWWLLRRRARRLAGVGGPTETFVEPQLPVSDEDVRPIIARVESKLDEGYSFERAVRIGLKEILLSPNFLFLLEGGNQGHEAVVEKRSDRAESISLDDHAIASRLSYFLWSTMPDEGLLRLAAEGRLGRPEVLRGEVERMLADPKAAAFTENFAGQWLGLRDIDNTSPDRQLYPEYDDLLRQAMIPEVNHFFEEVLRT
jgi:hypothetical protein